MKKALFTLALLSLFNQYIYAQAATQAFDYGGKIIQVDANYDLSKEDTILSKDFAILAKKVDKTIVFFLGKKFFLRKMDEMFSEKFEILDKKEIEFTSFGNNFEGYIYRIVKKNKEMVMFNSAGKIDDTIILSITLPNETSSLVNLKIDATIKKMLKLSEVHIK